MANLDSTHAPTGVQPPKGGYGFLSALLDSLDDQPLLDALQGQRTTGRPGYPARAMWRAVLSKFVLKVRYNNQLLERLRGSRRLREICGLGTMCPARAP